jgi:hypothetical protein
MVPKYLKVKATLERCSYGSVSARKQLLEHRIFFVADQISKQMKNTWTINDNSNYEKEMLFLAIAKGMLFELSELHTGLNFHFWLIVRQAEAFDCMYSPRFLKFNTTYYLVGDHNEITGPLYIHESDSPGHFRNLIAEGRIYVPAKRQLFEEYHKQHIA